MVELAAMATQKITIPYLKDKRVEDLLMWRDPVKSGIVFGGITLIYFIVGWSGLSAVDILAYVVFMVTVGSLLWAKFGHMVPNLPKQSEILPKFLEEGISEMQMKDFLDKNYARINSYIM